ncbi:MAG: DUF3365 domain-containing protein [Sulfurovum sp.]|nr:DUF3365 domain-containing protein [Sulfurovum sp.]
MIKNLPLALISLSILSFASENNVTQELSVKQEGIKYIKMLGGTLKKELQAKMHQDTSGESALTFCISKANTLTKDVNKKLPNYAKVRRTALKLRNNRDNHADLIDKNIMKEYEAAIVAKTFTPKDIRVVEEGNVTRVYKPLITMPVCLKCHGKEVDSALKEKIQNAYPDDKAMQFEVGTLRGVIVAEIEKH